MKNILWKLQTFSNETQTLSTNPSRNFVYNHVQCIFFSDKNYFVCLLSHVWFLIYVISFLCLKIIAKIFVEVVLPICSYQFNFAFTFYVWVCIAKNVFLCGLFGIL